MMPQEIQNIIVKYFNNEANFDELESLESWLKDKSNVPLFNTYAKTDYVTNLIMSEYDLENAKNEISIKIKKLKRKRSFDRLKKIAAAASISILIGLSIFLQFYNNSKNVNNSNIIEIGSNKAILTLENGDEVILEKGKKYETKAIISNGERIVYTPRTKYKNTIEKVESNILTVPRGGQFFIELSDGTKVWLNSDSKLKYPVKFFPENKRNVELVYGEAYFEVSPNKNDARSSFNVETKSQKINVLGTKFNIKAYKEDKFITTTLVEGSVKIKNGNIDKVLKPNQQSKINFESNEIEISTIDVSHEISWVSGLFSFNEASLENIMESLSRWYDVKVVFESGYQKRFLFTGILERSKSIEEIFSYIEKTSDEDELKFEIIDKTIFIK